jgi:hypothetical protein
MPVPIPYRKFCSGGSPVLKPASAPARFSAIATTAASEAHTTYKTEHAISRLRVEGVVMLIIFLLYSSTSGASVTRRRPTSGSFGIKTRLRVAQFHLYSAPITRWGAYPVSLTGDVSVALTVGSNWPARRIRTMLVINVQSMNRRKESPMSRV